MSNCSWQKTPKDEKAMDAAINDIKDKIMSGYFSTPQLSSYVRYIHENPLVQLELAFLSNRMISLLFKPEYIKQYNWDVEIPIALGILVSPKDWLFYEHDGSLWDMFTSTIKVIMAMYSPSFKQKQKDIKEKGGHNYYSASQLKGMVRSLYYYTLIIIQIYIDKKGLDVYLEVDKEDQGLIILGNILITCIILLATITAVDSSKKSLHIEYPFVCSVNTLPGNMGCVRTDTKTKTTTWMDSCSLNLNLGSTFSTERVSSYLMYALESESPYKRIQFMADPQWAYNYPGPLHFLGMNWGASKGINTEWFSSKFPFDRDRHLKYWSYIRGYLLHWGDSSEKMCEDATRSYEVYLQTLTQILRYAKDLPIQSVTTKIKIITGDDKIRALEAFKNASRSDTKVIREQIVQGILQELGGISRGHNMLDTWEPQEKGGSPFSQLEKDLQATSNPERRQKIEEEINTQKKFYNTALINSRGKITPQPIATRKETLSAMDPHVDTRFTEHDSDRIILNQNSMDEFRNMMLYLLAIPLMGAVYVAWDNRKELIDKVKTLYYTYAKSPKTSSSRKAEKRFLETPTPQNARRVFKSKGLERQYDRIDEDIRRVKRANSIKRDKVQHVERLESVQTPFPSRRYQSPAGRGRRYQSPAGRGRRYQSPAGRGRRYQSSSPSRRYQSPAGRGRRYQSPTGRGRRYQSPYQSSSRRSR